MKRRRRFEGMTASGRAPSDELLFAFIFAGWETIMPVQEAIEVADFLAYDDPVKARELSGQLVRGEPMTPNIQDWINSVRNNECRCA